MTWYIVSPHRGHTSAHITPITKPAQHAWAMTAACVEPLPLVKLQGDPALPATLRAPSNPAPHRWAGTAQVTGSGREVRAQSRRMNGRTQVHTDPPTLRRWKRTCLMRNFLIGLLQCGSHRQATQLVMFGSAWGLHHGHEHMDRTHVAYPCTSTMVAAQCKVQRCCAKRRAPLLSQARLKWYTDARPIAQQGPKHAYTRSQVRWSPVAAVVGGQQRTAHLALMCGLVHYFSKCKSAGNWPCLQPDSSHVQERLHHQPEVGGVWCRPQEAAQGTAAALPGTG